MKRTLIFLVALSLFLTACATTAPTPSLRGTITQRTDAAIVVKAEDAEKTVNVNRGTLVYWESGLEAKRADLTSGQRVSVWYNNVEAATPTAARIVIEN